MFNFLLVTLVILKTMTFIFSDSTGVEVDVKNFCEVRYLPPIILNFVIPPDYPSKQSPQFTLSCKWLTKCQVTIMFMFIWEVSFQKGINSFQQTDI